MLSLSVPALLNIIRRGVDLAAQALYNQNERLDTMNAAIKKLVDDVSALNTALVDRESAASDFRNVSLTFYVDVKATVDKLLASASLGTDDTDALASLDANLQSFATQLGVSAQADKDTAAQIPTLPKV